LVKLRISQNASDVFTGLANELLDKTLFLQLFSGFFLLSVDVRQSKTPYRPVDIVI